jgi:UDP-N-acetylmuramoyl-tripeptide--D-alanyl-D-alanine ligase
MGIHPTRLMQEALRAVRWRLGAVAQRLRLRGTRHRVLIEAASLRRRLLRRVLFIGVTGSVGKTTAKELIVALLSAQWRGRGSYITENRPEQVARLVWGTSSSDQFCVTELAAARPGVISRSLRIVRPRIGVVTTVGHDHISAYGTRERIAEEKGRLVDALPADGTAVLNADDALVAAMRKRCRGRVLTYGLTAAADVRGEQVSSVWPDRLRLTVVTADERAVVQTQLCGTHWTHSVLAAVATGLSLGMSLERCARTLAATPPLLARMEPFATPEGVVFIRDDWKAPLWTAEAGFAFMQEARAPRKVVVIGTLSDYGGDASAQYARVARRAREVADHVVFVGAWASRALRAARGDGGATLHAFSTVRQASDYLNGMLQPGDLVLLKATNRKDHLLRIILARSGQVQCWRDDCGRETFCDRCSLLSVPSAQPAAQLNLVAAGNSPARDADASAGDIVIGLGNPGARYAGTPHNVGHEVLDRLGAALHAQWVAQPHALVARAKWQGCELCLVKLQTAVNASGAAVQVLSEALGFAAADCILVHDDLDLPLGAVRARMRGSAGGHRGVASVLDAFQSDAVRRVKVGIGRPDGTGGAADYVLRPFAEADRAVVERSCAIAVERILSLATGRAQQKREPEPSVAATMRDAEPQG